MSSSTDPGSASGAGGPAEQPADQPRFMRLEDVMAELSVSAAQAVALVRSGDLPAIKVGGRGVWRVERTRFEEFIARMYRETEAWVAEHPFGAQPD